MYLNLTDVNQTLQLSPSGRVSVCPEGQITFVCTTNGTVHEWSVSVTSYDYSRSKLVTIDSPFMNEPFPWGTTDLAAYVTKTSISDSLPLISTLSLINVTTDLNGTVVECTDRQRVITAPAGIIHVIDFHNSKFASNNANIENLMHTNSECKRK